MKKRIFAALCASAMLCTLLAGCGGGQVRPVRLPCGQFCVQLFMLPGF